MGSNKQVTFNLPENLIQEMTLFVQQKTEPSKNALVRKALELYLEKLRQDVLQKAMEEAVADPMFMMDLEDSIKDFESIDREGESIW